MPVRKNVETVREAHETAGNTKKPAEKSDNNHKKNNGIFAGLEADDIILLAVIFMLLSDGCDDKLLLLAIAYVFISDNS